MKASARDVTAVLELISRAFRVGAVKVNDLAIINETACLTVGVVPRIRPGLWARVAVSVRPAREGRCCSATDNAKRACAVVSFLDVLKQVGGIGAGAGGGRSAAERASKVMGRPEQRSNFN